MDYSDKGPYVKYEEAEEENKRLKQNWEELKAWLYKTIPLQAIQDKMKELEVGELSNPCEDCEEDECEVSLDDSCRKTRRES